MNTLKDCLLSGLESLFPYVDELNEMNVFPITDGDTGSNLFKTLSQVKEIDNSEIREKLIMFARGNSGNILSLFFRYWPEIISSSKDIQDALPFIIQNLEKYIPNLQHGTMYDIMISWPKTENLSLIDFFKTWLENSEKNIISGPDKLKILDKYGTLDSGAVGLYYILCGISKEIGLTYQMKHFYVKRLLRPLDKVSVRYCVESLIQIDTVNTDFRNQLEDIGNSIIFIQGNEMVKVHIHTNNWKAIQDICRKNGNIIDWKVDDMEKSE